MSKTIFQRHREDDRTDPRLAHFEGQFQSKQAEDFTHLAERPFTAT